MRKYPARERLSVPGAGYRRLPRVHRRVVSTPARPSRSARRLVRNAAPAAPRHKGLVTNRHVSVNSSRRRHDIPFRRVNDDQSSRILPCGVAKCGVAWRGGADRWGWLFFLAVYPQSGWLLSPHPPDGTCLPSSPLYHPLDDPPRAAPGPRGPGATSSYPLTSGNTKSSSGAPCGPLVAPHGPLVASLAARQGPEGALKSGWPGAPPARPPARPPAPFPSNSVQQREEFGGGAD